MKTKVLIAIGWVIGTFLLLSWMLYAANAYESRMLAAVTGREGMQPTLERVKELQARKLQAKTIEEVSKILDVIVEDSNRYYAAMSASVYRQEMIRRAWLLWSLSAFVPLLFLWWPQVWSLWGRIERGSTGTAAHPTRGIGNSAA